MGHPAIEPDSRQAPEWPALKGLVEAFAEGEVRLSAAGLSGAARAFVVAKLLENDPRPALVLVGSLADSHRVVQDLKFFGAAAAEFPEPEPRLWRGGRQREAAAERALICRRLRAGEALVVVATRSALEAPLPSIDDFAARSQRLNVGDSLDRELLLEALERAGY